MSKTTKTRDLNARRLDVAAFARDGQPLQDELRHKDLPRLQNAQMAPGSATDTPALRWKAQGELRPVRGGEPQCWLHLSVQTEVRLQCQRCLDALTLPIDLERHFQFVADEALAAELDGDNDDADILVLDRTLNLLELIEDEVLLDLPIVPMHEECPAPLPMPPDDSLEDLGTDAQQPHPFAALAALKAKPSGKG